MFSKPVCISPSEVDVRSHVLLGLSVLSGDRTTNISWLWWTIQCICVVVLLPVIQFLTLLCKTVNLLQLTIVMLIIFSHTRCMCCSLYCCLCL